MLHQRKQVLETVEFLKMKYNFAPRVGILMGTGLSETAESIDASHVIPYGDIPHFPVPTVESHKGMLILGNLKGKPVAAMQGRFHLYEGYSPHEVTFPIRVLQELGVNHLILSNASGGINPTFCEGDVMIIGDHINLTGENPLVGANEDAWGNRFPDMCAVYDKKMTNLAVNIGRELGVHPQKGIYVGMKGPSLETPAEIRFLKTIGADAVGFSTVLEAIAGVHGGLKTLGLAMITNVHDPYQPQPTSMESVLKVAETARPRLQLLIETIVERLDVDA